MTKSDFMKMVSDDFSKTNDGEKYTFDHIYESERYYVFVTDIIGIPAYICDKMTGEIRLAEYKSKKDWEIIEGAAQNG